jgi:outer membrane protein assembly factor BamD
MMSKLRILTILSLVVMAGFLISCSTNDKDGDAAKDVAVTSAEKLYNDAADLMDQGNFKLATENFNEVERQHPYSEWATRAQLMAGYGYYKAQDYDQAILTLNQFIKLHPGNDDIDYAYYLKAPSFYDQITDIGRDQAMTRMAMEQLDILIRRFPNSRYTRDAILKRDLTLDHLAAKEMDIGRYYQSRSHHNAAINRFKEVVRKYETTTHTPEALHRMVESYMALGIRQEATRVAAVLGYNYPGSVWYEDSYAILDDNERARILDSSRWTDRTIDTLFPFLGDDDE